MIGTLGQLLLLTAFVACLLSGLFYFLAAHQEKDEWKGIARGAWGIMTVGVLVASGLLIYLILTHQFQYAYVYQYSSMDLPLRYVFSSFWAGQEGSFLLWIAFTAILGFALIKWARSFEAPTMTVVAVCQLFLLSMVVGLQFGPLSIGSSAFSMLADKFPNAPVFAQNPNFIPADGRGLNDLLQNYWMMIHPPTLFVGFTAMLAPFAFAIAALWKKRYTDWVRPALPWTLFANMILMVGIALGGYWAYETLNFGGYWAWDPVENSSFVPWLIGVAAIHMMIVQKKSGASHKSALFLCILAFMLVVYSTFLTRSGILGDISVHSFVDLGLNNQLLVWILAMGLIGFGLFAYRYRELPIPPKEPEMLSREFMIFSGALLLCALGAVVILGTSAPIFGRIFRDNPSAVPIEFYNKWTLPISIAFVFLAGLGQLFWWRKMSVENVNRVLLKPVVLSVVSTVAILVFTPFGTRSGQITLGSEPVLAERGANLLGSVGDFFGSYGPGLLLLLLVFVSFFALYGNGMVLLRIARGNLKMAGGAITHIGLVIMILGIISSSAFSDALSTQPGRENFVMTRGETRMVNNYQVTYAGYELNEQARSVYTLNFTDPQGRSFTLNPVAYENKSGQWIEHPDVKMFVEQDLFVSVSPGARFDSDTEQQGGQLPLSQNEKTMLGNQEYTIHFVRFDTNVDASLLPENHEIAVAAVVELTNLRTSETRELRPVYIINQDRTVQQLRTDVEDWGVTITFASMNVDTGQANFIIDGVKLMPDDWVLVQAYEKPFIGLVWIGLILMTGGFILAMYRRMAEQKLRIQRGLV